MNKIIIFFLFFFAFFMPSRKVYTIDENYKKPSIIVEDAEVVKTPKKEEKTEANKEYPQSNTSQYSNLKMISVNDLKANMKKESNIILVVTGTTCGHCKNYKPILNIVLAENKLNAYEIDAWKLNQNELADLKDTIGSFEGVPFTVIIKGGKVVDNRVGELNRDGVIELLKNNGFIN